MLIDEGNNPLQLIICYTNFSGQKSGDVDPGDLGEQHPGLPQTSNHPQCKEQYKVGVDMDFEIDCNIDLGHNLGV